MPENSQTAANEIPNDKQQKIALANEHQRGIFSSLLNKTLADGTLTKLLLSKYKGAETDLQRIAVRPIVLRNETVLSFVSTYKTRTITKNYPAEEAAQHILSHLNKGFNSAHLATEEQEIQLDISKKGKISLHKHKVSRPLLDLPTHNREKKRYVDIQRPYLAALGITDQSHKLIPSMSKKWKQINKFIEVLSQAIETSPLSTSEALQVVDFGSGKGYLTFALHDYLRDVLHSESNVTGVELRAELTELCNQAAKTLDHQGLNFVCGDVKTHAPTHTDIMIALHACDVATDYAIHYGIRANASIIMCSPCCHKQIRPQMLSPELMKPMLQYGVHLGQQAEMVTDSLRALLLEAHGYTTKVFEFISLEHTNKNKMILAVKKPHQSDNSAILKQIADIKAFYGLKEHCLESLLADDCKETEAKTSR